MSTGFVLLDFEKERRRLQMAELDELELNIPGYTFGKHYFYFPGSSEWFVVNDMTAGQHAEYSDLGEVIRFIREPIKQAGEDPNQPAERVIEERSFPSGSRQYERFRILVPEWSLVTKKGKPAMICRTTWNKLPPAWSQYADRAILAVNPELLGETREDRNARLPGEVDRPEPKAAKTVQASPAT